MDYKLNAQPINFNLARITTTLQRTARFTVTVNESSKFALFVDKVEETMQSRNFMLRTGCFF